MAGIVLTSRVSYCYGRYGSFYPVTFIDNQRISVRGCDIHPASEPDHADTLTPDHTISYIKVRIDPAGHSTRYLHYPDQSVIRLNTNQVAFIPVRILEKGRQVSAVLMFHLYDLSTDRGPVDMHIMYVHKDTCRVIPDIHNFTVSR